MNECRAYRPVLRYRVGLYTGTSIDDGDGRADDCMVNVRSAGSVEQKEHNTKSRNTVPCDA